MWWLPRSKTSEPLTEIESSPAPETESSHPTAARLLNLQRFVGNQAVQEMITPQASVGEPLDPVVRRGMESRFGEDFSDVRVHTDSRATESAETLHAEAYTRGRDIYFAAGKYAPNTSAGERLLAHELTHTVQQSAGHVTDQRGLAVLSRADDPLEREADSVATRISFGEPDGSLRDTRVSRLAPTASVQRQEAHGAPAESTAQGELRATNYRRIGMRFDGDHLIVFGDDQEIFRFSAQSGRPLLVTAEHARACQADPVTATYMNDKRFVGIKDFGPIPEGRYAISPARIQRFTSEEERRLLLGGIFGERSVTAAGSAIHPGDWGSGRVALTPIGRLREGPCGNTNARSAFFLHGGIMAGSSGCIDIGGDFNKVADFLSGFRGNVVVTVEYTNTPPSVGYFTGLSGAIGYGGFDIQHGPRLRLGAEFATGGARALVSPSYDVVAAWAGGALTAGVHLDVPFDNRDSFVRAGLTVGTNFRLLGALYGRLYGGITVPLSGRESGVAGAVGAGLGYDFGRVQLEALYDVLRPASEEERVHQVLLGVGFRFGRE